MYKLLVLSVVFITGCATNCPGTRYYDIQYCKGEQVQRLPNFHMEALQREAKCNANIQPEVNCVWGRP